MDLSAIRALYITVTNAFTRILTWLTNNGLSGILELFNFGK